MAVRIFSTALATWANAREAPVKFDNARHTSTLAASANVTIALDVHGMILILSSKDALGRWAASRKAADVCDTMAADGPLGTGSCRLAATARFKSSTEDSLRRSDMVLLLHASLLLDDGRQSTLQFQKILQLLPRAVQHHAHCADRKCPTARKFAGNSNLPIRASKTRRLGVWEFGPAPIARRC